MRTIAIGDIHGCAAALARLLELVELTPQDRVVTLGDYVDRGPDSRGVLELLIGLYERGQLVPLLGNHEEMMLAALEAPHDMGMWLACGGDATLISYGAGDDPGPRDLRLVPEEHWRFLREACRSWYEIDTHFFVHANVYPDLPLEDQPTYILHWEKLYEASPHQSGKVMVCGHTQQREGRPLNLGCAVCIDTAAYRGSGWLTCLEPATGRIWQASQSGQCRKGWLPDPEEEHFLG